MTEQNNQKFVTKEELDAQERYLEKIKDINSKHIKEKGASKKYLIKTFGCQMNENDSEKMAGALEKMGYECAENQNSADIIIFNTCCVRENAELKVYGHLGELKALKKKNPELVIGVCGCMMHQEQIAEYVLKTFRHVDIIFGNSDEYRLPEFIYHAVCEKKRQYDVSNDERIAEGGCFKRKYPMKAYVIAMYGCNNFCSYCIVPHVRGRERSRRPEDILNEVRELAENGCKEVMLLGQNVNSYGKDLEEKTTFAQLIGMVNEVEGIERIRFMTSHPKDLSDELIEAYQKYPKLCYHLHLPLQSGNSKVLKEMNRKYDKEKYLMLIEKVKKVNPGIGLTTDIIVGFPGETDEEFEDTLDVVEKAGFDSSFTFIYSKRTGTAAAKREDQIPQEIVDKRFARLLELQNRISREQNDKLLHTVQKVLVEGKSRESASTLTGRTTDNKVVNFVGDESLIGQIVEVKIVDVQTWSLKGEICESEDK